MMSTDGDQNVKAEDMPPLPEQTSSGNESTMPGNESHTEGEAEQGAFPVTDKEKPVPSSVPDQQSIEKELESSLQSAGGVDSDAPADQLIAQPADVDMEDGQKSVPEQHEMTGNSVEANTFRFEEPDSDDSDYDRDVGTRSCLEISRETEMDFEWTKYANDVNCFNIEDSQFMGSDEQVEVGQLAVRVPGLKAGAVESQRDDQMYESQSGVPDIGEGGNEVADSQTSEMPRKSYAGLAFARKTIRILKNRCTMEVLNELLDEAIGIEVDQRLTTRLLKCQSDLEDLRSRAVAFLESERQDLRVLRMVLNDLERFPVITQEEERLKEVWKSASQWLEKARVILSFPRKTRKCRRSMSDKKERIKLQDLVSLINEGNEIKVLKSRRELDQIKRCLLDIHQWSASAHEMIQSNDPPLDRCQGLLSKLEDLVMEPENASELKKTLWRLQAQSALDGSIDIQNLRNLAHPTEFNCEDPAIGEMLGKLRTKLETAEDWIVRAKNALSYKIDIEGCKSLLETGNTLKFEANETFLLQYHVEGAENWMKKAQDLLASEEEDQRVFKALHREGEKIAVRLDLLASVKKRIEELIEKEQEDSMCSWAQCDGCNKWRRLKNAEIVHGKETFFCKEIGKSCDQAEDEWDEEEEITALYDGEGGGNGSVEDDIPLATRRLLRPGSVVYAQYACYPFWPACIRDPARTQLSNELNRNRRPAMVLARFYGTGNLEWVHWKKVLPFDAQQDPNTTPVTSSSYRVALSAASNAQIRQQKKEQKQAQKQMNPGLRKRTRRARKTESGKRQRTAELTQIQSNSITEGVKKTKDGETVASSDSDYESESESESSSDSSESSSEEEIKYQARSLSKSAAQSQPRNQDAKELKKALDSSSAITAASVKKPKLQSSKAVTKGTEKESKGGENDTGLPVWFTKLPVRWQSSYSDLCAIRDSEQKLKERLVSLTSQKDIRREVRNMVTCSFMGALQASSAEFEGSIGTTASSLEESLWTECGSNINQEYRKRYRIVAMALRSRNVLRSAALSAVLPCSKLVRMSLDELDRYEAPATSKVEQEQGVKSEKQGVRIKDEKVDPASPALLAGVVSKDTKMEGKGLSGSSAGKNTAIDRINETTDKTSNEIHKLQSPQYKSTSTQPKGLNEVKTLEDRKPIDPRLQAQHSQSQVEFLGNNKVGNTMPEKPAESAVKPPPVKPSLPQIQSLDTFKSKIQLNDNEQNVQSPSRMEQPSKDRERGTNLSEQPTRNPSRSERAYESKAATESGSSHSHSHSHKQSNNHIYSQSHSQKEPHHHEKKQPSQPWQGTIGKAGSSKTKVQATSLTGGGNLQELPAELEIVGRMRPQALIDFLQKLDFSKTRQKTVIRFDLCRSETNDKVYKRLIASHEEQERAGVVSFGEDSQIYVLSPSLARTTLPEMADSIFNDKLYGICVMRKTHAHNSSHSSSVPKDSKGSNKIPSDLQKSQLTRGDAPKQAPWVDDKVVVHHCH
eukprot:754968-Hanusia_phi.AAC.4